MLRRSYLGGCYFSYGSKLDNLIVIVDSNGYQNDGAINEKMSTKMLKEKWKGFGWTTIECNGHKIDQLLKKLSYKSGGKPTAIIAKTVKGKGVKFMENNNDWHHGRLTQKLYDEAIKGLKNMKDFNLKDAKQWSRMGPRAMFGQFMLEIAEKNENLMVLSADLGRSSGLDRFKKIP